MRIYRLCVEKQRARLKLCTTAKKRSGELICMALPGSGYSSIRALGGGGGHSRGSNAETMCRTKKNRIGYFL